MRMLPICYELDLRRVSDTTSPTQTINTTKCLNLGVKKLLNVKQRNKETMQSRISLCFTDKVHFSQAESFLLKWVIREVICGASCGPSHRMEIAKVIIYLVNFINVVHENDAPYVPAKAVPGTYNPETATAYYFTEHGCRVRETPNYTINGEKNKGKQADSCTKNFPKVSQAGYAYSFFFFCPIHGHCLGFHVIDGSEGRKDCITPLYSYMNQPPSAVFLRFGM